MVKTIRNQEYFHVTRALTYNNHAQLQIGTVFDVGANNNPFFGWYEGVRAYPVATPNGQVEVPAINFLKNARDGTINCPKLAQIATEIAEHYVMLVRELIMEQVRIDITPDAPSRQRCLWLADTLDEAKTWQARLGGTGSIARLKLSGTIHRVDASHLLSESEPLATTYARARSYWNGEQSCKPELETLFCGVATVIAISD